jgi:hypothetical protein
MPCYIFQSCCQTSGTVQADHTGWEADERCAKVGKGNKFLHRDHSISLVPPLRVP